mmetsp:Transcript_12978/g.40783  ORF Transcript_12978/g.40783 Transcript_12978/m.40783 type:complete len:119 (+) Transcript_12978:555-911(+)
MLRRAKPRAGFNQEPSSKACFRSSERLGSCGSSSPGLPPLPAAAGRAIGRLRGARGNCPVKPDDVPHTAKVKPAHAASTVVTPLGPVLLIRAIACSGAQQTATRGQCACRRGARRGLA